jgi:plasmid stabilization system protein ParE
LREARAYLHQPGSGPNAWARWAALRAVRARLRTFPYLGGVSVEHPGLRQLVVAEHRILYRVDPDTGDSATAGDVLILLVLGPGMP